MGPGHFLQSGFRLEVSVPLPALAVGETRIGFSIEPLFRSIDAGGQGVAAAATWQLLTPDAETDINPWDACHALLQQGLGVSGGGVEFAEPDLAQRWRAGDERGLGMKLAKSCGESDPQNKGYPVGPSPYWIRDVCPQSLVRNFWHFGSCGAGFWLRSLVAIFQFPFRWSGDWFDC
jgi:hypothetical protein